MESERIINRVINREKNTVPLDLTQDTVEERNLYLDETAHNREGEPIRGELYVITNYDELDGRPKINNVTVSGEKTGRDYHLVDEAEKGVANGVATLNESGIIPSTQLPAYVDGTQNGYRNPVDGLFYEESTYETLIPGVEGLIYVDIPSENTFRWTGLVFVEISHSLAIGETDQTAYQGSKGKKNAEDIAALQEEVFDSPKQPIILASALPIGGIERTTVESALGALNDYKVEKVEGKGLSTEDFTTEEKQRLATIKTFEGATATTPGKSGVLPAPNIGDQNKVLFGNGNWDVPVGLADDMTGATASADGAHGLVPKPFMGDEDKALFGDGTWRSIVADFSCIAEEETRIARYEHTEDDQFFYDGNLLRATDDIDIGDEIKPDFNLFDLTMAGRTVDTVTFSVNADKSISISGTVTTQIIATLGTVTLAVGTYTVSSDISPDRNGFKLWVSDSNSRIIGDDSTTPNFTIEQAQEVTLSAFLESGKTYDHTFYPKIVYNPSNCTLANTITDQMKTLHGGHTIVDEEGTTYPARAKLKFVNATVTDDSTNDTTIIEAEGGGGTIVVVPTVTNTSITYDGTEQSPTITRDTDHTYIQGDYEATNYGTYTFTIGLSGVNDVWSDNTTEPKSYTWSINYDGGTITPVNDIQTWLKCANIDDKAYTTLSEVLADHETLYALINNNNATDYLVRSTSWVSDITADETAMEYIGHKNYASNTLLDDSTWCTAICNSAYFESVLRTKVPTMTSNTTPYGVASASGDNSGSYPAWKAFNNDNSVDTARWMDYSNTIPHWIQYEFDESINIKKVNFVLFYSSLTYSNYIIKILASNDSSFSSVLYESPDITISNTNDKATYSYDTNSNVTAKFWRVVVPNGNGEYSNVKYSTFWDIQFYGRTDITENQIDIYSAASDTVYYMDNGSPVTVCTTDTAGHGTVSKSSLPNGTYTLYSTVAKDPENLSNDYSKSVTIADNTLEIKVMPDNALYWYGNKCEWLTGGWDNPGSYMYASNYPTEGGLTFNTNDILMFRATASGAIRMAGTSNKLSKGTLTNVYMVWTYNDSKTKTNMSISLSNFYVALHTSSYSGAYWGNYIDLKDNKDNATNANYLTDPFPKANINVNAVWLE